MEQKTQVAQIQYPFDLINQIWEKARIIPNFDPAMYRKDRFGAWIKKGDYGMEDVKLSLGWSIVTCIDEATAIDAESETLIPLHWQNASLYLQGYKHGVITASGIFNIKV